jgi:uncharacterized protein YjbJ (UPF0337 family)
MLKLGFSFMNLNSFTNRLSTLGRRIAASLLCLLASVFVWQGASFNPPAMAAPLPNLIAAADVGSQIQGKTSEDAGRAKNFIRDTKNQVEQTAKNNAARVDEATGDDGGFVEGKAKRDAARIQKRAEEDAARTQKAVDASKNAVERTVDSIKDAFSS